LRICLVYDCLYPYTVGGAERWYRSIAERLAAAGHDVSYLTLRQWPADEPPDIPGVRVVAVGPRLTLYTGGRRRIVPPLVFGLGVLRHLVRRGRRYDVVHTASFPYFSLLAAALARPPGRYRLAVDWHELWTREYWHSYLGAAGQLGWAVQLACLHVDQRAFCFSRLVERRLRDAGLGDVTVLEGQFAGEARDSVAPEPVVVFAGRLIPEKRAPALVRAFAHAREAVPELRLELYGDGPDRAEVDRLLAGLGGSAVAPGFVELAQLRQALARALCLALPSEREGYGQVVVEAAALGVPSVVVASADNAAAELIEEGVNGTVAASAEPEELAAAIVRVRRDRVTLGASTAAWYARNAERLSVERSLDRVLEAYGSRSARS
jgi:glycosyltransferase involved in cell wall biosynthesis